MNIWELYYFVIIIIIIIIIIVISYFSFVNTLWLLSFDE